MIKQAIGLIVNTAVIVTLAWLYIEEVTSLRYGFIEFIISVACVTPYNWLMMFLMGMYKENDTDE